MKKIAIILCLLSTLMVSILALDFPLILGERSAGKIMKDLPAYKKGYTEYKPDIKILNAIKPLLKNIEIYVVYGSWCSDSLHNVPRFMKIMNKLSFPENFVHYIGVDRNKIDPDGISENFNIQRVPTFIFLRKHKEIGRIIENPKKSLETDMLEILSSSTP